MQFLAQLVEIEKGEDRGRGAAFHIAGAAPVDAAVDQRPAPWVLRPAIAVADREHVDMAVEREVAARLPGRERRDDVRHRLLWRDHAILDATPVKQPADVSGRRPRIPRRVGARAADEPAQKIDQHVAVALDPLQQLSLATLHCQSSPG
jgi:hypothetical protein